MVSLHRYRAHSCQQRLQVLSGCLLPGQKKKKGDGRVVNWWGCWSKRISRTWRHGRYLTVDHSDHELSHGAPVLHLGPLSHPLGKDCGPKTLLPAYDPKHIDYLLPGFYLHLYLSPAQSHLLSTPPSLFSPSHIIGFKGPLEGLNHSLKHGLKLWLPGN